MFIRHSDLTFEYVEGKDAKGRTVSTEDKYAEIFIKDISGNSMILWVHKD